MNAILKEEFKALEKAQNAAPANSLHPHEALDILLRQRFGVEYQPIVDTASGDIAGFEALARFWRADGTPVAPDLMFGLLPHRRRPCAWTAANCCGSLWPEQRRRCD